jgi:hypothetical protein
LAARGFAGARRRVVVGAADFLRPFLVAMVLLRWFRRPNARRRTIGTSPYMSAVQTVRLRTDPQRTPMTTKDTKGSSCPSWSLVFFVDQDVCSQRVSSKCSVALERAPVGECSAVDVDGSGIVEVYELVRGVDRLLRGCAPA